MVTALQKASTILRLKNGFIGLSFSTTEILTLGAAVGMVAGSVASASAQFFGVRLEESRGLTCVD